MARVAQERWAEQGSISNLFYVSDRRGKSLPVLAEEQLRAGHRCSRSAFCPFATCEIALCDGIGFLACGRKQLQPLARAAAVTMRDPCLGSSGSGRRACDWDFHHSPLPGRPNASTDEQPARFRGKV